jgi:acyl carrier protein
VNEEQVLKLLKDTIADQLNVSTDQISISDNLRKDLSLNTIQYVELVGRLFDTYNIEVPSDLRLARYKTVDELGAYIFECINKSF